MDIYKVRPKIKGSKKNLFPFYFLQKIQINDYYIINMRVLHSRSVMLAVWLLSR